MNVVDFNCGHVFCVLIISATTCLPFARTVTKWSRGRLTSGVTTTLKSAIVKYELCLVGLAFFLVGVNLMQQFIDGNNQLLDMSDTKIPIITWT